jgi:hypothetical protein
VTGPFIPLTNAPELVKVSRLDIATGGTVGAFTYTEVKGLKSLQDANSYSQQDTTVFETGNRGSDMPTQYKKTITFTLQKYVAESAVQELLRVKADALELVAGRIYNRNGSGKGHAFTGFVQWEPQGGAGDGLRTINVTIPIQDWEEIDNPAAATPTPPTITSVLPASAAAGEWTEIVGTHFLGATSVKFGTVEATEFLVISATRIHAKVPAGAAGSVNVTVTTPDGTSAGTAYTRA